MQDERGASAGQVRRDLVISALALVSVGIAIHQIGERAENPSFGWLDAVDLAIVAVFVADYVREARRCGDWRAYLRLHWWELPSLIPVGGVVLTGVPGLPLIRGVRLVRLLRVLRLVRLLGLAARLRKVARYVHRVVRRANLGAILLVGAAAVTLGAIAAFALERDVNARMAAFGDAAWWSLNMFTNVAYVDFQPATPGGRVLAGALEVCGIGFIGVLTASLAGAILQEPRPDEEDEARP